jgi:hypothetical protein
LGLLTPEITFVLRSKIDDRSASTRAERVTFNKNDFVSLFHIEAISLGLILFPVDNKKFVVMRNLDFVGITVAAGPAFTTPRLYLDDDITLVTYPSRGLRKRPITTLHSIRFALEALHVGATVKVARDKRILGHQVETSGPGLLIVLEVPKTNRPSTVVWILLSIGTATADHKQSTQKLACHWFPREAQL